MDIAAAGPTRVGGGRAGVTGEAIPAAGYDMAWIGCRALCTLGALRGIGTVVAGVAAAAADRRVSHRVGDEACRRVGVAIAALDAGDRDMRRRGVAGCDRPVVAAYAIGIARLVGVNAARPTGEGGGRAGVAGDAVASCRRHMAGIRGRTLRSFGALRGIGTVVTGVAARRAHRRMGHRVGDEACRRVGVAIAALDAGDRDMRRRGVAGCDRPVVAAYAIGIARLVGGKRRPPNW